jgi:voltage-gated potassium channel
MTIFLRLWNKLMKLEFLSIFLLSLLIILIGTVFIHVLEPENFPTYFEGFWWTMTTLTTVGYGDYSPTTVSGRLLGIFLFVFGIGLIGVLIGKIVDAFTSYSKLKTEGKLMYKKENHYIYIGWSNRTKKTIMEVLTYNPDVEIVLIDDLPKTPIEHHKVHFIQGDPSDEEVLLKANILKAKRVAIFADTRINNPLLADGKSLLIASAVEALSEKHGQNIHTVVEVCEEKHIPKFKHIQIDDFILSNDSISLLMAKATLHPGTTGLFRQLLSKTYGSNIHELHPKKEWKTYEEAYQSLFEHGAVLVSVNDKMDFAQTPKHPLTENDLLYIVCKDEVFNAISSK